VSITFFVQGEPKSMSVGGVARFKKGGTFHLVPKRTHTEWAVMVGHIGRQHAPAVPLEGPISFTARFFMPKPASAGRKVVFPMKRPDVDNLMHKLTDQWNGVFWLDDSQIVDLIVSKRFAADRCGVEISVELVPREREAVLLAL